MTMIDLNLNCNLIHNLGGDLWKCQNLKILRLQNNRLSLNGIPEALLAHSSVSNLMVEGNLFEIKESISSFCQVLQSELTLGSAAA